MVYIIADIHHFSVNGNKQFQVLIEKSLKIWNISVSMATKK